MELSICFNPTDPSKYMGEGYWDNILKLAEEREMQEKKAMEFKKSVERKVEKLLRRDK